MMNHGTIWLSLGLARTAPSEVPAVRWLSPIKASTRITEIAMLTQVRPRSPNARATGASLSSVE